MIVIGVCLAMDASAVACCNGMALTKVKPTMALSIALSFGLFQGFMPLVGYFVGSAFSSIFASVANWIAFGLLALVGINMIRESRQEEEEGSCKPLNFKLLMVQSVATSLDALAVGVSFAVVQTNIFLAATVIAITTTILSFMAVYIGNRFGNFLSDKAELAGGVVLILIGLKMVAF
jgi:putative Mn2+ efflux pump MntP